MRSRLRRGVLAGALCLAAGAAVPASPAVAQAAVTPTLTGSHVVHYAQTRTLLGAQTQMWQGTARTGGGCTFSGSGVGTTAKPKGAVDELAFDPDTCRSLVQVGTPTVAAPATGSGPSVASSTAAASTYYAYTAHLRTWFSDPVGIVVNLSKPTIGWNPGNGCANNGPWYAGWYREWYSQDGWYATQNSPNWYGGCYIVTNNFVTQYQNNYFCGISDGTYHNDTINGDGNPNYSVSWQLSKWGGCSGLLGWHADWSYGG